MNFEYIEKISALIQEIDAQEKDKIEEVARLFADNIKHNHIIHTVGSGHSHMIGLELFGRAGGLANVNAMIDQDMIMTNGARRSGDLEKLLGFADIIYDQYKVEKGDILLIISNSGRNAFPIEIAMRAKKEGITTIALTNLKQSQEITSRHFSGKKLYECVDIVIDTHAPFGDAMMTVGNVKTGGTSTILGCLIMNTIVHRALEILHEEGEALPVLQSQNVDGFDNDALYAKYESRVKHF